METLEIKKRLYIEKPIAKLMYIRSERAYYQTRLEDNTLVNFEIPVNDMGSADFFPEMEAKYMIRWII